VSIEDAWWAMAMIRPDGTVVDANPPFADVVGHPVEEVLGRSLVELVGADALAQEIDVARRLLAGEAPLFRFRRTYELPDGRAWHGVVLASLLRDDDGEPELFHVRLSEPGDRRPPERIAWKEGDFPLALDAMRVGVAIIGLDGMAIQVNRAMCEIAGRSEDELRSVDLLSMTHPDDRGPDVELGTRAWMGEIDHYTIEKRLVRPDGSIVWVRQDLTFARDDDGQPLHLVGQVIDIGEQKALEQELARSRQELARFVEQMPVGLLSSGPDGRILTANAAAAAIAGVPEIPRGADVSSMIHPDDLPLIASITLAHARQGSDYDLEFRLVRPDGTVRWVRNDARPELAPDGSLAGISGTWRDVTELKAAEERLRRQATHDALTGLANRHLFFDALSVSIDRCAEGGVQLSVLFVDLDGFKAVNDTHGHGVGDRVLALAAERIRAVAHPTDVVARFGGDEFIVRCEREPGSDAPLPAALAEAVIDAVRRPYEADGHALELGASVGIATWTPGATADDLVSASDRAVYAAKAAGRNCWRHA
jgi:diguanylate cyclase (GGDEF)-like protein/PAS domain S-box-containing protein